MGVAAILLRMQPRRAVVEEHLRPTRPHQQSSAVQCEGSVRGAREERGGCCIEPMGNVQWCLGNRAWCVHRGSSVAAKTPVSFHVLMSSLIVVCMAAPPLPPAMHPIAPLPPPPSVTSPFPRLRVAPPPSPGFSACLRHRRLLCLLSLAWSAVGPSAPKCRCCDPTRPRWPVGARRQGCKCRRRDHPTAAARCPVVQRPVATKGQVSRSRCAFKGAGERITTALQRHHARLVVGCSRAGGGARHALTNPRQQRRRTAGLRDEKVHSGRPSTVARGPGVKQDVGRLAAAACNSDVQRQEHPHGWRRRHDDCRCCVSHGAGGGSEEQGNEQGAAWTGGTCPCPLRACSILWVSLQPNFRGALCTLFPPFRDFLRLLGVRT